MNEIIKSLKPKEVISFYNKKYIEPFLQTKGFQFKENSLEYHRKTSDFKQVIWHRCSKNNMTGHIIDFEIGYYNLCPKFKRWYMTKYGKDPVGGEVVTGTSNIQFQQKWNGKYNTHIGVFGYDLINKNIEDQFDVILENLENVMVPYLDFYYDFENVIDNPRLTIPSGEIDIFSQLRQIEHCLFLGMSEKAETIANSLINNKSIPENYYEYRDMELKRIFQT